MHLYKIFSARRYIALTASVKVRIGSQKKQLGTNKFVRTKSHTGIKFSQIFWGCCAPMHLYCGFSLRRQMAPQQTEQSAKFGTAFWSIFYQFEEG